MSTDTAHASTTEAEAAGVWQTWRDTQRAGRAILLGIVVNRFAAFLQLYLVLFLTNRGFSAVQAGFALGAFGAGAVAGVLFGGTLTDKLGSRRTILVSMSGTATFVLAVLYVHYYPALLVAVVAVAAIGQAYRPASSTLLAELTPKARMTMTFAMYRLSFNVGSMVAPLLGAVLVAVSYDLLFWGEALAALGYAAIAVVALPRRGGGRVKKADGTMERSSYLEVVKDRRFTLFLLSMMINAVVYIQYISVLPLAMKAAGLATGWYAAMVALNGFIVLAFELLITKATQRWPIRIVMMLGFLLLGGGRALYAIPWGLTIFIAGTLIWTLAEIIAGPTMFAYPPLAAPDRMRGRYIAASGAMFGVGTAIGPIVGLALWSAIGTNTWWVLSLLEFAGLAAAMAGVRQSALARAAKAQPDLAVTPLRVRVQDWLHRAARIPDGVVIVQQLFRDRTDLWRQVATQRGLPRLIGRLASVGAPALAVYGFVLGADGGFVQMLASAVKLPLLFAVAAAVCLPTLYVFCRIVGAPLTWLQAVTLATTALTVSGVTAMAVLPISLFFLVTAGYLYLKVLSILLLVLVAVAGIIILGSGVIAVSAANERPAPIAGAIVAHQTIENPPPDNGSGDAGVRQPQPVMVGAGGGAWGDTGQADGGRRPIATIAQRRPDELRLDRPVPPTSPPQPRTIRVLVCGWGLLFGLVGSHLGWVLRPFFGAPDKSFAVLRSIDGSFVGDVVHTIGQLISG